MKFIQGIHTLCNISVQAHANGIISIVNNAKFVLPNVQMNWNTWKKMSLIILYVLVIAQIGRTCLFLVEFVAIRVLMSIIRLILY